VGVHARQGDEASVLAVSDMHRALVKALPAALCLQLYLLYSLHSLFRRKCARWVCILCGSAGDPRGWRVRLCYLHMLSLAPRQRLQNRDTDPLESVS
jgi:hypothetical protein